MNKEHVNAFHISLTSERYIFCRQIELISELTQSFLLTDCRLYSDLCVAVQEIYSITIKLNTV